MIVNWPMTSAHRTKEIGKLDQNMDLIFDRDIKSKSCSSGGEEFEKLEYYCNVVVQIPMQLDKFASANTVVQIPRPS